MLNTLFEFLMPLIISLTCIHFTMQGQYSGIGTKEVLFIISDVAIIMRSLNLTIAICKFMSPISAQNYLCHIESVSLHQW